MRFSRRALAQAAIVSVSFTGLAAFLPSQVPTPLAASPAAAAAPAAAVPPSTGPLSDVLVTQAIVALDALRDGDRRAYQAALVPLAAEAAFRGGVDSAELTRVWGQTDDTRMTALLSALTQIGVKYRYASATPGAAFDCSGLVSWAWAQAGRELPHQSKQIINATTKKDRTQVLPGDVFWYPGHISLALGVGNAFVHAPYRGRTVEVRAASASKRLVVGSPV
jgi:cell wall-associated NlpC family hydrolase